MNKEEGFQSLLKGSGSGLGLGFLQENMIKSLEEAIRREVFHWVDRKMASRFLRSVVELIVEASMDQSITQEALSVDLQHWQRAEEGSLAIEEMLATSLLCKANKDLVQLLALALLLGADLSEWMDDLVVVVSHEQWIFQVTSILFCVQCAQMRRNAPSGSDSLFQIEPSELRKHSMSQEDFSYLSYFCQCFFLLFQEQEEGNALSLLGDCKSKCLQNGNSQDACRIDFFIELVLSRLSGSMLVNVKGSSYAVREISFMYALQDVKKELLVQSFDSVKAVRNFLSYFDESVRSVVAEDLVFSPFKQHIRFATPPCPHCDGVEGEGSLVGEAGLALSETSDLADIHPFLSESFSSYLECIAGCEDVAAPVPLLDIASAGITKEELGYYVKYLTGEYSSLNDLVSAAKNGVRLSISHSSLFGPDGFVAVIVVSPPNSAR